MFNSTISPISKLSSPLVRNIISCLNFFEQSTVRVVAKIFKENAEIFLEISFKKAWTKQNISLNDAAKLLAVAIYCPKLNWIQEIWATLPYSDKIYNTCAIMKLHNKLRVVPPPIVIAASVGDLSLLGALIQRGASVNYAQPSPLTMACSKGRLEIARCLIHHKADINEGSTCRPLKAAIAGGHAGIVQLLRLGGAKIDLLTEEEDDTLESMTT